MDSLYIVMPAYNEEKNIKNVLDQWYPLLEGKAPGSKLVVADSGSTDATHQILLSYQKSHPALEILSDTARQHGPKVIALYKYAIKSGADFIFQTDSDGQTSPDEFPLFWQKRTHIDAVIGNRLVREDGRDRAFVEKVVCLLLRLYFGVRVPDANAPFRLMKSSLVGKYIHRLPDDYGLPNIMLTMYFSYYEENIQFVPISFKPRQGGENSINIPRIIGFGYQAMKDFAVFRKQM